MFFEQFSTPLSLPALTTHLANAKVEIRIKAMMSHMAWLIWKCINERIFQQLTTSPTQLVRQLLSYFMSINKIFAPTYQPESWSNFRVQSQHTSHTNSLNKLLPPSGKLLLNFDASEQPNKIGVAYYKRRQ